MERTVNLVGQNTLTVSIPSKWAGKYSIKKGDRVHIEENGAALKIISNAKNEDKEFSFCLKGVDRTSLILTMRYCYRSGIDLMSLQLDKPYVLHRRKNIFVPVISAITEELSRLMGMEIIEQKEGYCQLKYMLNDNPNEFDQFLRKTFWTIQYAFEAIMEAKDKDVLMREVQQNHDLLTMYTSYCARLMNRYGCESIEEAYHRYCTLSALEMIMDIIQNVARRINKKDIVRSQQFITWLIKMKSFFERFIDYYYNFNIAKMSELSKERIALEEIYEREEFSKEERDLVSQLSAITIVVRSMTRLKI